MEDTKLSWPIFQPTTEIEAAGPIKVEGIVTEVLKAEEGAVGEIIDTQQDVTAIASEVKPAPRTVNGRHQSRILETFVYVVLAIGASMFLSFALLAASVHHTYPGFNVKYRPLHGAFRDSLSSPNLIYYPNGTGDVSSYPKCTDVNEFITPVPNAAVLNNRLRQADKLGPTIFRILLAGTVGSTLRLLARWRAEKGSSIERFEVLIGSTSLTNTLSTLFSLGTTGTAEISLILLWALSPLAGQASLRVLGTTNVTNAAVITTSWSRNNPGYVYTTNDIWLPKLYGNYIDSLAWCQGQSVNGAFYSYNQNNPSDWAVAPLIPMIAHNETWIRSNNSHVILPYTELQTTGINFTKFVGFSIFSPEVQLSSDYGGDTMELSNSLSFPISLNSSLNFTISHFEFSCQSVSQCSTDGSWMSLLGPDFIYANSSALLKQAQFGSGFSINTNYTFSSQADPDGAQFITFGSFYNSNVTLWSWQIFAVTKNISIFHQDYHAGYSVFRTGGLDFLESMDPATVTTTPPFTNYRVAASLFAQWSIMDAASSGVSSITEQYLAQGLEGQNGILNASLVDLSDVDSKTFASRLTTMFNTYIQTLQGCSYYGWEDVNGCALNATSSTPLQFQPFALVTCNWVFFAILTIASTLLLICSCLSIWLSYRLSTPDIMGHMSSLAIENPDIPVAGKASGLNSAPDGFERAKLLRDVKVQIRDVQQEDEVGKFTLTSDIRQRQRTGKDRKFV